MAARRKRVLWSPSAREDARNVWRYFFRVASVEVADDLYHQLIAAGGRIAEMPLAWRLRDDIGRDLRCALVRPYAVFFRIEKTHIQIVRIIHSHRNFNAIFKKRKRGS